MKELRDSKRLTQDLEESELSAKNEGNVEATHERNIVVTQEVNHRSGASSPSLSIGEIPFCSGVGRRGEKLGDVMTPAYTVDQETSLLK